MAFSAAARLAAAASLLAPAAVSAGTLPEVPLTAFEAFLLLMLSLTSGAGRRESSEPVECAAAGLQAGKQTYSPANCAPALPSIVHRHCRLSTKGLQMHMLHMHSGGIPGIDRLCTLRAVTRQLEL